MRNNINCVAEFLIQTKGIDIRCYDDLYVSKLIEKRLQSRGLDSDFDYCRLIDTEKNEALEFLTALNNTFSEFFRNTFTFEILGQFVIPELTKQKKEIRIWSAACAAGQEPYSIAILCDEFSNSTDKSPRFRIFASDINSNELKKAVEGVYTENSLGNVTLKRLTNYFVHNIGNYSVKQNLKNYIDFSEYNLFTNENMFPPSSIFGNFDLDFCTNLLFYFKPECRQQILKKITGSLAPG
ncbi:MAG: protein-glutamate O-methyltransferase CheR, partial [Draconibacterium sp.]